MNIKALITTLAIVGSSSVAMARPISTNTVSANASLSASWSFGFGSTAQTSRPVVRDHRTPVRTPVHVDHSYNDQYGSYNYELPVRQGYPVRDWMTLGTRESGATTYFTMPTNDPIHALHLEASSGRPAVTSIFVRYHDGSQQEIPVNASLLRGGITVPLVVKNSPVHQIIFWSPDNAQGTFTASIAL